MSAEFAMCEQVQVKVYLYLNQGGEVEVGFAQPAEDTQLLGVQVVTFALPLGSLPKSTTPESGNDQQ